MAAISLKTVNRQAVTAAQARIDRLLAADPLVNGKSLSEGLYAIDVHPQRVVFELDDSAKSVTVVSVSELV